MDVVKAKSQISETAKTATSKKGRGRPPKRRKVETDDEESKDSTENRKFQQPTAITGGKLKDYQLDGVAWMVGLYDNGISGILGMSL